MISWLGFQVFHLLPLNCSETFSCLPLGKDMLVTCHAFNLQIFAAVPFVYELREILDWSATATTLRLYDWLKLEVG